MGRGFWVKISSLSTTINFSIFFFSLENRTLFRNQILIANFQTRIFFWPNCTELGFPRHNVQKGAESILTNVGECFQSTLYETSVVYKFQQINWNHCTEGHIIYENACVFRLKSFNWVRFISCKVKGGFNQKYMLIGEMMSRNKETDVNCPQSELQMTP